MTDEQRIALRLAASGPKQPRVLAASGHQHYTEVLNGRQHPEYLMPYELFDSLTWGVRSDPRLSKTAHRLYDAKIASFGYDVDSFWQTVGRVAKPYLIAADSAGAAAVATGADGRRVPLPISVNRCRAQFAALQQARRDLGGERFDEFLYVAVAPEVMKSEASAVTDRALQLRYVSGGCQ